MAPRPRLADAASDGFRVARTMYWRWRRMGATDRERLAVLAADLKERALDLRGDADPETAGRSLDDASRKLAAAMVKTAEADPGMTDEDVAELRGDLARELERLASGDVRASRGEGKGGAIGNEGDANVHKPL
jgi:hypothetical protein